VTPVWCAVHQRDLTWHEQQQGGCFWCDASLIPMAQNRERPGAGWEQRRKIWQSIIDLTPEQRQALIPNPAPGPGVVTPSQAWLERWARNQKSTDS
jgi:hypothetical protein